MNIVFFLVLVSVNRLTGKCITEYNEDELINERFEEIESPSGSISSDRQSDDFKDFDEIDNISKMSDDERNTPDEVIREKKADKAVELNSEDKSSEGKSNENIEEQLEIFSQTPKAATDEEGRITRTISETSAESKFSDNQDVSTEIFASDRNIDPETRELEEKTDKLDLDEKLSTRRMISSPHNIDVTADFDSTDALSKVNILPQPSTSTFNNNNEFAAKGSSSIMNNNSDQNRLFAPPTAFISIPGSTTTYQDLAKKRKIPVFYPKLVLNLNLPYFQPQLQGSQLTPVYFKRIQNYIPPRKVAVKKEKFIQPINQQDIYIQSYNKDGTKKLLQESQNEIFNTALRNQAQLGLNQNSNDRYYIPQNGHLYQEPSYQFQHFYTNQRIIDSKTPNNNKKFNISNHEPKKEVLQFFQSQAEMDFERFFKDKQQEKLTYDRSKIPFLYSHTASAHDISSNAVDNNYNLNSQKVQTLYQKLAEASNNPKKII